MGESLEYPDVLQEVRGAMNPGRLKLQSSNITFKNIKTGKVDQFPAEDVIRVSWLIRARGYCLKVQIRNGAIHRFDGFREAEYEKLAPFVKQNYQTPLEKIDTAVKGWNWGTARFRGTSLDFEVNNKSAFEIPLGNVSHSVAVKNEVTLEFHQNDEAAVSLMELRFHIPTDPNSEKEQVDLFYKNIIDKADIIQATGDAIAIFSEVVCLTPRGRYDIKMYPSFLQLHGKTFDYKIPYTTILRLFLLPHKDGRQMFFVVSLDPPIKQGQTRYHFLIVLFNKEDETTLELGISEEDIQEKYEGKLQKEMSGLEYEIISRIMKSLVNRKITVPGSFIGHSGSQCLACSYKAATGLLYPLERGFIFVHKPPLHVRFDEVANINFARSSANLKSFDFEIYTKGDATNYTFVGIEKEEYGKLYDFVRQKKLRVKNIGGKLDDKNIDIDEMLGSDDDENDHDAYMERMKREGRGVQEEADPDFQFEDEDSAEDEDFHMPEQIDSEVDEEYDTEAGNSGSTESSESEGFSGEDEEARAKRKEKKKKEKQRRKVITIPEESLLVDVVPPSQRKKKEQKAAKRRTKKGGKNKDPNKPKRPMSSYFLWFNENRPRLKDDNPDASMTELSKIAGALWQQLAKEDKATYEQSFAEAKVEYEKAMEEYNKNKPDTSEEENEEEGGEKAPKKAKKKKAKAVKSSPTKGDTGGAGGNYKSKEFIESESSSSPSDDDAPLKKKPKKEKKKKAKKEKAESDEKASSESEKDEPSSPVASDKESEKDEPSSPVSSPVKSEPSSPVASDNDKPMDSAGDSD